MAQTRHYRTSRKGNDTKKTFQRLKRSHLLPDTGQGTSLSGSTPASFSAQQRRLEASDKGPLSQLLLKLLKLLPL